MAWDRAPEELTWERLLGLDGSLIFLEHVFWVISLNTLFVLIFGKLLLFYYDLSCCLYVSFHFFAFWKWFFIWIECYAVTSCWYHIIMLRVLMSLVPSLVHLIGRLFRLWHSSINFRVLSVASIGRSIAAFCPYHIGQWTINGLRMTTFAEASRFEGVLTSMVGYVVVAICLILLHTVLAIIRLER